MGHQTEQREWDMWKALLPGGVVLVTLGLSLVSGEVATHDGDHKQVLALAQSGEPLPAKPTVASSVANAAATNEGGPPVALVIGNAAYPDVGLPLAQPVNNARALAAALKDTGFDV